MSLQQNLSGEMDHLKCRTRFTLMGITAVCTMFLKRPTEGSMSSVKVYKKQLSPFSEFLLTVRNSESEYFNDSQGEIANITEAPFK